MNLHADIVPNESIGGIQIGQDANPVLQELEDNGVRFSKSTFLNSEQKFYRISINNGALYLIVNSSGKIVRIWCTDLYKGSYKSVFRPGMTVSEAVERTGKQLVIHGMLILDGEFGMGFSIPDKFEGKFYDDIESVNDLPGHMKLDELHVMHREWWR